MKTHESCSVAEEEGSGYIVYLESALAPVELPHHLAMSDGQTYQTLNGIVDFG